MNEHNFPLAVHSYFRVLNVPEAREKFLQDTRTPPTFKYSRSYSVEVVEERLKSLGGDVTDEVTNIFSFIGAGLGLQSNTSALEQFRHHNARRYGEPDLNLALAVIARIGSNVDRGKQKFYQEAVSLVEVSAEDMAGIVNPWPTETEFNLIRAHGVRYMENLIRKPYKLEIHDLFNQILAETELTQKGWTLVTREDASHARTSHRKKQIRIGSYYRPRTVWATRRIVAHEIFGHALRGFMVSEREAEGFAILLEQLLAAVFKPRRMYRYLAAALGWGVDGVRRDFVQVYEILWRLIVSSGRYDEESAKSHAFNECARVFRGGRPDVAGAVFLKDIIYLDANLEAWRRLSEQSISYNDFMKIAKGEKKVLSE